MPCSASFGSQKKFLTGRFGTNPGHIAVQTGMARDLGRCMKSRDSLAESGTVSNPTWVYATRLAITFRLKHWSEPARNNTPHSLYCYDAKERWRNNYQPNLKTNHQSKPVSGHITKPMVRSVRKEVHGGACEPHVRAVGRENAQGQIWLATVGDGCCCARNEIALASLWAAAAIFQESQAQNFTPCFYTL